MLGFPSMRTGVVCLLGGLAAWAQNPGGAAPDLACKTPHSTYEGFTIGSKEVRGPLPLPSELSPILSAVQMELSAADSIWHERDMGPLATKVRDAAAPSAAATTSQFSAAAAFIYIDHCDTVNRRLDLVAYVIGTRIFSPDQWTWDATQARRDDPRPAAGLRSRNYRFRMTPIAGYNSADSLQGGARMALDRHGSGFRLGAEGVQANRFTNATASGAGDFVTEKLMAARIAYAAGFRYHSEPLLADRTRQGYAFGWLSGATRPSAALGGAARYAAQYERGYQSAANAQASGTGYVSSARYSSLKLLAGLSGGVGKHDYSVTAGFQIGAAGISPGGYGKALLDGAYSVRLSPKLAAFDHRFIDLEFRGTGGWLDRRNQGVIPVNERFFGGNRPRAFTDLPEWDVRSAPYIRSFANNRLFSAVPAAASGGERFFSFNLTTAFTSYRYPLIPKEVREAPDFKDQINAGKGTAEAVLESYYESKDPAILKINSLAKMLDTLLVTLTGSVSSLTVPSGLADAKLACSDAISDSQTLLKKAREQKTYAPLTTGSQGALQPLITACQSLGSAADPLRANLTQVGSVRERIADIIKNDVNHAKVERLAKADSQVVKRALDAFANEINLFSIDPLVMFDQAWVRTGPAGTPALLRYAAGGGVRITLASTVSFQAGYAVNVNRGMGEPRGAVFFGLRFFDLIR
jgi:hypothetical protein